MARPPQRQHFLPRFYLRQFAEPIFSNSLLVFDIKSRRWVKRSPKGIGWFSHFYSYYDLVGERRFEFDAHMKQHVEDPAAPALKKLAQNSTLNDAERSAVALFISVTAVRNPDMMKHVSESYYNNLSENDRIELDKMVDLWTGLAKNLPPRIPAAELLKTKLFDVIWGWSQDLHNRLLSWKWYHLTSDPSNPFVTSDRPVYAEKNDGVHLVSFPISSQKTLLISDQDVIGPRGNVNPVALVNRQTISNATAFVVASRQSFPGDSIF